MSYIKQLTFLRFLAAILVVVFHFGQNSWPFSSTYLINIVREGSIAVSFFFFLSGVVLTIRYLNEANFNTRSYFLRRFARIYPVYLLAFLITLVLAMVFNNAYPKGLSVILQALALHAWHPGTCLEINFPGWSISVEVFFYVLFPLFLKLVKRLNDMRAIALIISFWLLSIVQHYMFSQHLYVPDDPSIGQFILYFPLWHLNTFLCGILCGKYIIKRKEKEPVNNAFLKYRLLLGAGMIAFFATFYTDNPFRAYTHNGLLAPIFFMIVAGLALDQSILTKALSHRFLILLGNSSYSIYLFQWPLFIAFCAVLKTDQLAPGLFYLYLLTLIGSSILIYELFEKRMKNVIVRKWLKLESEI